MGEPSILNKERILELLREQFAYLSAEYGIRKLGLFGSFATGSPGKDSDVDLFVEFEHPLGLRFMELGDYLEKLLGRKVDILTSAGVQNIRRPEVANSIVAGMVDIGMSRPVDKVLLATEKSLRESIGIKESIADV